MRKNKLFIISIIVIGIVILGYAITKYFNNDVEHLKYSTIKFQKFDEPPVELPLKDEDSIFHSKICSDYGVAWDFYDKNKKKHKIVLFDSGLFKLLIYYTDNINNLSKIGIAPADKVFSWDFSNKKLNGMYDVIEKDTTFYWRINEKKQQLIDENGNVFKKIRIAIKKNEE
jgi:hypothetical protein